MLVLRTRGTRLFVSYLAVANLFFLGSFFFLSPTSELVAGGSSGDLGDVSVPTLRAPVVVIVLDEFPAATIMRADGSFNDERYPGFAELASVSTWFRNASSQYNLTHRAVPIDPRRHVGRRRRPADVGRPPAQPVHAARRRRAGPPLRVGDRPVPADGVRTAAPPAAQPGDRGCLGGVRPPRASRSAARRPAGHRQLVGGVRRRGRRDHRRRPGAPRGGGRGRRLGGPVAHREGVREVAGARRRRAQPARPGGCAPRA